MEPLDLTSDMEATALRDTILILRLGVIVGMITCTNLAMKFAIFSLNINKKSIPTYGLSKACVKRHHYIASRILHQWVQKARDHA